MQIMKKKIAVALTAALLAFPLSSVIAEACIPNAPVVVASTIDSTEAVTPVTTSEVVSPVVVADVLVPVTTAKAVTPAATGDVVPPVVVPEVVTPVTTPGAITTVADADGKIVVPSTKFSDFIDKLQLALAFDPARTSELNKRHALRKLAQAQQLLKDGNIEACKISFNEYKDKIAKAQAFLLEAEDANSATAKTLAEALANVDAKNIQVLSALAVKLPPQAAQKLALNVVRTMDKAVVKIQKDEVKVAPVVTPVVAPVVLTDPEKRQLEKQAKAAVTDFKTSVNGKDKTYDKTYIKDQKAKDNQCTTDQKKSEINQKLQNLSQVNYRTLENNKDDRNKDDDCNEDKSGDNNRRDHK